MNDDVTLRIGAESSVSETTRRDEEAVRSLLDRWQELIDSESFDPDFQSITDAVEGQAIPAIDSLIERIQSLDLEALTELGFEVDETQLISAIEQLQELKQQAGEIGAVEVSFVADLEGFLAQTETAVTRARELQDAFAKADALAEQGTPRKSVADLNKELSQANQETQELADRINQANADALNDGLADVRAQMAGAREDLERARGKTDDWRESFEEAEARAEAMAETIGRSIAAVTTLVAVATQVNEQIDEWAKETTGFNDELQRTIDLQKEIAQLQNDRLSSRQEEASQAGTTRPLEELQRELVGANNSLENTRMNLEEVERRLAAIRQRNDQAPSFLQGFTSTFEFFDTASLRAAEDRLTESFDRQKQAAMDLQEAINAATEARSENQTQADDDARVKRQEDINAAIEREIALRREATLRADGDTDQADELRIERERRENASRLGQAGADRIAAAEREQQAAERAAEAREQADRESDRNRRERERESDQAQRRLARLRREDERETERAQNRIATLAERRARLLRERRTPIGGFDRGFGSFSDRIANSAAGPDENREELRRINAEARQIRTQASREHSERLAAINAQTDAIKAINTGMTS